MYTEEGEWETPIKQTAREVELERHIQVLRDALQDAPHSSSIDEWFYGEWYRQQRGPALESTDPIRWSAYRPSVCALCGQGWKFDFATKHVSCGCGPKDTL